MVTYPTFEEVCQQTLISGSIKIIETADSIRLEKKTGIIALLLWLFSLVAGFLYFSSKYSIETLYVISFISMLAFIGLIFIVIALLENKKPSILVFDKNSQMISAPRYKDLVIKKSDLEIHVAKTKVYRSHKNSSYSCQILVLYIKSLQKEVPIFHDSQSLKSKVQKMAKQIGVTFLIKEKEAIHLY